MAHPGNDSRQQFTARDLLRHSPNEVRAGTENAALDRLWQQRIETVQGVALAPAELVGMRIWSQVLTWFLVSHTAKSQVPQMSAKQQECDSVGSAQGAKDLSAINPAAPATMLALPGAGAAENGTQPDRYLCIPAVRGVVSVGDPRL
jgi:hypothetical protein